MLSKSLIHAIERTKRCKPALTRMMKDTFYNAVFDGFNSLKVASYCFVFKTPSRKVAKEVNVCIGTCDKDLPHKLLRRTANGQFVPRLSVFLYNRTKRKRDRPWDSLSLRSVTVQPKIHTSDLDKCS